MKILHQIILLTCLFSATLLSSQILTYGEAINKAGKQRMLTMKMAKNYLSIGAGVRTDEAAKELEEASTLFNENYNDLVVFAKSKEAKDAINFTGVLWAKFRDEVNSTPTLEQANNIISDANNLVNACSIVVDKFVSNSNLKTAMLPNICGRQRLYSQKLAMLYLAKYWQVSRPELNKELSETLVNYENGLKYLLSAAENTDDIKTILKLQQTEWAYTKKSFEFNSEKMSPTSVYSSANLMTKNFDRATALYEKLVVAAPK